jgi:hypothetical protein
MPAGRPTIYSVEYAEKAAELARAGLNQYEMAAALGVHRSTIQEWRARHEEFASALKDGLALADERVERSLYNKATGYDYEAEKIVETKDGPEVVKHTVHVPASDNAIFYWLGNRSKGKWVSVNRQVIVGDEDNPLRMEHSLGGEAVSLIAELIRGIKPDGS